MIAMKILTSSVITKSAKKKKTWGEANCAPQTPQAPLDSYQPPPFFFDLCLLSLVSETYSSELK